MARVKRGNVARNKRKKILKATKGYRGAPSRLFRSAERSYLRAGKHAYRDRRNKKRFFRRLWITRINAASRNLGIRYNSLIALLDKSDLDIDRKALADLAMNSPKAFEQLVIKLKEGFR